MNESSSLDETYSEYSLAPTDDLIRFWRSKVKVTAGIHVNASQILSLFVCRLGLFEERAFNDSNQPSATL